MVDDKNMISIEVTTQCNVSCPHCFARGISRENSSLSLGVCKEVITEAKDLGYKQLHVTGGEPLLWNGLFRTLGWAFELGYESVFLNTNGTLLTEDMCARLASYEGLSISISLDGPEDLHNCIRPDAPYENVLKGIERALAGGNRVYIFSLATKSLLSLLPHFAEDTYGMFTGLSGMTLLPIVPMRGMQWLSNEYVHYNDFPEFVRELAYLNLYGLTIEVLNEPLVNVVSRALNISWIPFSYDLVQNGNIMVTASGEMRLSHSSNGSFGKYGRGMIGKVLGDERYRGAVGADRTTCPSCKYLHECQKAGMIRPTSNNRGGISEAPYCKRVMGLVLEETKGH
ncbi:MAG: radical SAM protein [Deltaproteobacteria bacterium]|nr:radical SAM protein [Deltaproteobacteria bacterium]